MKQTKGSKLTLPIYPHWRRVSTLTPEVSIGAVECNTRRIVKLYNQAVAERTLLAVTPELSLTGYSLADGFGFNNLQAKIATSLQTLAAATKQQSTTLVVGAPILHNGKLYNCGVVLSGGNIIGIVPKQYLANYSEFYEKRWFVSGKEIISQEVVVDTQLIPFGIDLLFQVGDVTVGIEICEDLWVVDPPSRSLAQAGAEIICNLSSSTEIIGKGAIRRALVAQTAERLLAAYLYVSSDSSESTTDVIMSGHAIIAEFDSIIAERKPLTLNKRLLVTDIDIAHIRKERRTNQSWEPHNTNAHTTLRCNRPESLSHQKTNRFVDPHPFVPKSATELQTVSDHILNLQAHGLKKRMSVMTKNGVPPNIVLGLSGGLDSTLALLAAARTCDMISVPRSTICTLTMPAHASSKRTQDNATMLAKEIGTTHEIIPIQDLVQAQLKALGHNGTTQDITYENTQARTRTELLFNRSNQIGGFVLGTGDMSELALGWCTFNGDHMSNYAVNAGVPKTLVRYVVETASLHKEFVTSKDTLRDILMTPISPELTGDGTINQETEQLVGPYELHDFFMYHLLRWGSCRSELLQLAVIAFKHTYTEQSVAKWIDIFCQRFITQQFKRSTLPDGVKVGRICLSPRGDLRFPSDANLNLLLDT
jgi:NAD+ synthase (glutamine-hydrolysing)